MRTSVVVTTYNRPLALERVLHALAEQDQAPSEVLVADDGSGPETRAMVERWADSGRLALRHVWHEDHGFRAAAIRNRAAGAAAGDLLLFLDGDCVPGRSFVRRSLWLAEPGWVVAGDRILLTESLTRDVERGALALHRWGLARWIGERARGRINRLGPLCLWPTLAGRGYRETDWRHLRSANMGISRRDFESVDGFDESFQGWGFEDSELAVRLINAGVRIRTGRCAIGVFHLWHPENSREAVASNQTLLEQAIAQKKMRALQGLSSHIRT